MNASLRRVRQRWGVLLFVWVAQLLSAVLVASPVVGAIAGTGVAAHPRGDAVLFEPGGVLLIETLRVGMRALTGALGATAIDFALVFLVGLVPLVALLVALESSERLSIGPWLGGAISHFPAFVLIGGASLLARAILLVLLGFVLGALGDALSPSFDARRADLVLLSAAGLSAALLAGVGICADLARAAAVRERIGALRALRAGLRSLFARPGAAALGWLIPAVWSVFVLAAAALLVGTLHVELAGSWRVALVLVIHQLAVFVLLALRALWLSQALELVGSSAQAVAPIV